ncbi:MAG: hypothetical protein ACN6OP_13235 [Pseudomonadales bacterium]
MNRIKILPLCAIFMALLSLVFNGYVVVYYDYWFSSHDASSFMAYLPAAVAVFLPLYFSENLKNPSDFLCWTYYLMVTAPTTALVPQLGVPIDIVFKAGAIVILANAILALAGKVKIVYVENSMRLLTRKSFSVVVMLLGLVAMAVIFGSYKFNIDELLSFSIFVDTYEIRANFRESGGQGLATYVLFWAAKVIFPAAIAYGLCFGKRTYVWLGLLCQLLVFSVSAHKSFVFSAALIFVVYFLLKRNISFRGWLGYASAFVGFSWCMFYFFSVTVLVDVFVRRAFIVPGILSGWWVDYFSGKPHAFFAGGLLGNFFSKESQTPAAFQIGDYYLGNMWTSANVNFAVDAFGNAGPIAVVIAGAMVFVALTIINGAARLGPRERVFFTCLSVPLFWTLIETSLVVAVVTHGLFILLALALLWKGGSEKVLMNPLGSVRRVNGSYSDMHG